MTDDAPRIKFCGLTRLDDAQHAVDAGAWAIGLIFWPASKRAVALDEAERIGRALRRKVELVGVFVDQPLDEVVAIAEAVGLTMVQLHGDEGPRYADEVARRTGTKVLKAARVQTRGDVDRLAAFSVAYHLVDAHDPALPGGTGHTFDWSVLRGRRSDVPLVLSGGLTPENVAEAIRAVKPFAVDVASGVESAPGVKDHAKLDAFAAAVRSTAPARPASAEVVA
ncbi:phosphoribosylanthranilate isomerase [Conexibacter sp. SYSU D00693]|uniref:phosphoribosylanthranilate isomerase n=1 Tax=Conexibacter sp. SYSU D00693 TaxID=2812560 RepID=UPI00196AD345|nr:phosphoribosylanthranilate isomerase [Conexibacter sp. SYSU D00693]